MAIITSCWLLDLLSVLIVFIGVAFLLAQRAHRYWEKKGVSFIKPTPFIGNAFDSFIRRKNMALVMKDIYLELKGEPYGGFYIFTNPVFLPRDPELLKAILVKDFNNFRDHEMMISEELDPLEGKSLFNIRGQRWRHMRVKLSPVFTSGKMKNMFRLVQDCAKDLQEYLELSTDGDNPLEVKDFLSRFTVDVIASCAFGVQCNSFKDPDAEFVRMGRDYMDTTSIIKGLKVTALFFFPKLAKLLRLRFVSDEVNRFFRTLVRNTIDYRESNYEVRNDFMDLLIQLKTKGHVDGEEMINDTSYLDEVYQPRELDYDDITAQALIFFIGGFETSSTAMSFALYELALNPDIQENLRDEIDAMLEDWNGRITYQGLQELEYLHKVVSETLRKYPPAAFTDRVCNSEYKVPGTDLILDAGMTVEIPILGIHYDERFYPDPEKFDPERFSEENKKERPNYTYLPFGEGPRMCIGMRFGLMQTKVGLVTILSKFEVDVCEKTPIPMEYDPTSFVLAPKNGMWLRIKRRTDLGTYD